MKVIKKPKEIGTVKVIMDTTYWGRTFGVMVFKDSNSGNTIYKQYVKYETNKAYYDGINHLIEIGYKVASIVCDGRKGLLQMFTEIPVQMCQFHQLQIITRYLTRNPKLQSSKELREITMQLTKVSKLEFESNLNKWYLNWEKFINERSESEQTGKSFYTQKVKKCLF